MGGALIDEIASPHGSVDYVGGAGLNVAAGLARLGIALTLIAVTGEDRDGLSIRAFLQNHNVHLLGAATCCSYGALL